jgi:hypothetical protein
VALSEEELRMLQQMERALVEEDPKFASTLRGTSLQKSARQRVILAGAAFVAGIALLMTGAVMRLTLVGVAGFVVMLASATVVVTVLRLGQAESEASAQRSPEDEPGHGSPNPFDRRDDGI